LSSPHNGLDLGSKVAMPQITAKITQCWSFARPFRESTTTAVARILVAFDLAPPTLDRNVYTPASGLALGAYMLAGGPESTPEVMLVATESEVTLAISAYDDPAADGVSAPWCSACRRRDCSTVKAAITSITFCRRRSARVEPMVWQP